MKIFYCDRLTNYNSAKTISNYTSIATVNIVKTCFY